MLGWMKAQSRMRLPCWIKFPAERRSWSASDFGQGSAIYDQRPGAPGRMAPISIKNRMPTRRCALFARDPPLLGRNPSCSIRKPTNPPGAAMRIWSFSARLPMGVWRCREFRKVASEVTTIYIRDLPTAAIAGRRSIESNQHTIPRNGWLIRAAFSIAAARNSRRGARQLTPTKIRCVISTGRAIGRPRHRYFWAGLSSISLRRWTFPASTSLPAPYLSARFTMVIPRNSHFIPRSSTNSSEADSVEEDLQPGGGSDGVQRHGEFVYL